MANKLNIIILFLVFTQNVNTQISFFNTYGGNGYDYGQGVVQLPDSSYAITGASSSFYDGPSQAFILLVDSLGEYIWSRSYGGEKSDWGRRIFYKENEGFWIAGYSNSYSDNADFDFYLIKTDTTGEPEWERTYGTSEWERLWDAIQLFDNGFILVGETNGILNQNEDIYIVRTDFLGDTVWTKRIQTLGKDVAYACHLINDTTFLIGGISSNTSNNKTGYLASFHINGDNMWEQYHGDYGICEIYDIDVLNSDIFAVGSITLTGETHKDHWMIRTNVTGDLLLESIDSRPEDDWVSTIAVRDNQSMYITAWTETTDFNLYPGGPDLLFVKYHTDFYWNGVSAFFSAVNPDECHQTIISLDGGPVLVGFMMDPNFIDGGAGITLIKIASDDFTPHGPAQGHILVNLIEQDGLINLKVYPNPVIDDLIIEYEGDLKPDVFTIFDSSGKMILHQNFKSKIDFSEYPKGIYFVSITTTSQDNIIFRIVK